MSHATGRQSYRAKKTILLCSIKVRAGKNTQSTVLILKYPYSLVCLKFCKRGSMGFRPDLKLRVTNNLVITLFGKEKAVIYQL